MTTSMIQPMILLFSTSYIIGFFYTFLSITLIVLVTKVSLNNNRKKALLFVIGYLCGQTFWLIVALNSLYLSKGAFQSLATNKLIILIGACLPALFGINILRTAKANPSLNKTHEEPIVHKLNEKCLKSILTAFTITLMIPQRLIAYLAFFTSIDLNISSFPLIKMILMIGAILIGSLTWWLSYIHLLDKLRHKLTDKLHYFNYIGGGFLIFLSIGLIWYRVLPPNSVFLLGIGPISV